MHFSWRFVPKNMIIFILVGFVLVLPVFGASDARNGNQAPDDLYIRSLNGGSFPFNPAAVKSLFINGTPTVFSLEASGEIAIWKYGDGKWVENQRLSAPGIIFATFQLQDIDRDGLPEIIAGTIDSGFIYLYHLTDDPDKWTLLNSEKYVWATITNIAAGYFDDSGSGYILVQNREGFLDLFKVSGATLNLVWRSPNAWRPFVSVFVKDIDGDGKDEITVSYQNGAVAVLRMVNNAIVPVWENFVWGKILSFTAADWNGDQRAELIFSTTQKLIYFLGYTDKGFRFETQISQFPFIAESLAAPNLAERKELLIGDTAGKFHVLDYNPASRKWRESANTLTGRTAQIMSNQGNHRIWLLLQNQNALTLDLLHARDIQLKLPDRVCNLQPALLYQNGRWYLAPRSLKAIDALGDQIQIQNTAASYRVMIGKSRVELLKKKAAPLLVDGVADSKPGNALLINNELYLSLELWQRFLNLHLNLDLDVPVLEQLKDEPVPL